MASGVYPDARWKFYIDAAPTERARRRHLDVIARGREASQAEVLKEIEVRDHLDSTRRDAPLTRAEGAVYVDTTDMELETVILTLLAAVEESG